MRAEGERSGQLLSFFLGLHVAQVTNLARFKGGLLESIAAVELDSGTIGSFNRNRNLGLDARHESFNPEATLGVGGDGLSERVPFR
jgi:hypothetical protein